MDKLLALCLIALLVASVCEAKVVLPEFVDEQENDVTDILDGALEISKALGPGWAVEPLPAEEERDIEPEPDVASNDPEAEKSTLSYWINKMHAAFSFQCPHSYQAIYRIRSIHKNWAEDRLFGFNCRQVKKKVPASCHWTGYVNKYDRPVNLDCGANKYLGGIASSHSDITQDRIWKFYCCSQTGLKLGYCYKTFWTNDWNKPQEFKVPFGYVLTGTLSYHSNSKEDRRFAYTFCEVK